MIKYRIALLALIPLFLFACKDLKDEPETYDPFEITIDQSQLTFSTGNRGELSLNATCNKYFYVTSNQSWCRLVSDEGYSNEATTIKVKVTRNRTGAERVATLTFAGSNGKKEVIVKQAIGTKPVYELLWADEFNALPNPDGSLPMPNATDWKFETGTGTDGWGNNELQEYVDRTIGTDTVAKIKDGKLIISALKHTDANNKTKIVSARMNTTIGWQYGYFEMSAKLPGGKGTWAAFWMMPKKDNPAWPLDGEIDIMEYVGYQKDVTHTAIHTKAYNHKDTTQIESHQDIKNVETEFHRYSLEWDEDVIIGYVDGIQYFEFENDGKANRNTWPFDAPFNIKLNLAIGGAWGGTEGVDDSIFPARYEIDYIRVSKEVGTP